MPSKGKKPAQASSRKAKVAKTSKNDGVDSAAKRWVRLLRDPCGADPVPGCYPSLGTGYLIRCESDFIIGAEATSVGAVCIFTPGVLSQPGGTASVFIPSTVVNSETIGINWVNSFNNQPGNTMAAVVGQVRAVAACVRATYAGTEQNRGGFLSMGQMTQEAAFSLGNLAQVRANLERTTRMPGGTAEFRMEPNAESGEFMTVMASGAPMGLSRLPTLVVAASGLAPSTGIRVRLTTVFEWVPKFSGGMSAPYGPPPSSSSYTVVLRWLNAHYPNWQVDLLGAAATGVLALA